MKFFLCLPFIFASSCATTGSGQKSDKYQMEMTLHKTRADLEEAKHDLHSLKMELTILEGKMINHEDQMAAIKKDTFDIHQTKLENCHIQIATLEKKFSNLEGKLESVSDQLQKFASMTNELTKALAQGKEKISELERSLAKETKSTSDLAKKITLVLEHNTHVND